MRSAQFEVGVRDAKGKWDMKCSASNSLALAMLLAMIAVVCQAQDFSADVVYTKVPAAQESSAGAAAAATAPASRIFVSKANMRLESRGMIDLVMLVDTVDHTTVVLYPGQKTYRKIGSRPSQYFRSTDVENACTDWQEAAGKQLKCEKVGEDVVGGRRTIKYKNPLADGSAEYVWIDSKLSYVIKWDLGQVGAELHNIKEGPQSADLFEIPKSYDVATPARSRP
jgi:hypothetical protein